MTPIFNRVTSLLSVCGLLAAQTPPLASAGFRVQTFGSNPSLTGLFTDQCIIDPFLSAIRSILRRDAKDNAYRWLGDFWLGNQSPVPLGGGTRDHGAEFEDYRPEQNSISGIEKWKQRFQQRFALSHNDSASENTDWKPVMKRAARALDEKLDIELSEDLSKVFEAAEKEIVQGSSQASQRRLHLLLMGELFVGIADDAFLSVTRLGKSETGDNTYVDLMLQSSQGPIKAKLTFRKKETAPLLRVTLTRLQDGHTFDDVRIGCDNLEDMAHAWPHMDIGPAAFGSVSWAKHIDLYPSQQRDQRLVRRNLMFAAIEKMEIRVKNIPKMKGAAVEIETKEAGPGMTESQKASDVQALPVTPPVLRKLNTVEMKEFRRKLAASAGLKAEKLDYLSNESLHRLLSEAVAERAVEELSLYVKTLLKTSRLTDAQQIRV